MDIEETIKAWAEAFPASEVEARIAELESAAIEQREALANTLSEIERLRQLGQIGPRLVDSMPVPDGNLAAAFFETPVSRPKTRSAAVLRAFDGDHSKTMTVDEIHDQLARRGWLGRSSDERHSLQVALSNMVTKSHELERPKTGSYRLAGDRKGGF
jgi:hypothetical protein